MATGALSHTILNDHAQSVKSRVTKQDEGLEKLVGEYLAAVATMSAREAFAASGVSYTTVAQMKRGEIPKLHPATQRKMRDFVDKNRAGSSDVPRASSEKALTLNRSGGFVQESDTVSELVGLFPGDKMLLRLAGHVPARDLYRMAMDLAIELEFSDADLDRIHAWGKQLLKDEKNRS